MLEVRTVEQFLGKALEIVKFLNGLLWNNILLVILVGCGIYFTILLKGIQVRKIGKAFKNAFSGFSLIGKKLIRKVCLHSNL